jgi:hypothetical protein
VIPEAAKAKLRRLMEARDKRDKAKKALETAEKDYREIEAEVHEELSESVEGTLKVPLGPPWGTVSFLPKSTTYSNVLNEDRLLEYLEDRALVDEYTKPSVVKGRLNELVREIEDTGEQMPPGLDAYKRRYVQITKQKSK